MPANARFRHSEDESDAVQGVLFRLGTRFGVIVAAGVFGVSLYQGAEPAVGLIRASLALVALTGLAWFAEQIVRMAPPRQPAAEQERAEAEQEPVRDDLQQAA